jgi:hypothetical protein
MEYSDVKSKTARCYRRGLNTIKDRQDHMCHNDDDVLDHGIYYSRLLP